MFTDAGNDRQMSFGVFPIPERIEATGPRRDISGITGDESQSETDEQNEEKADPTEILFRSKDFRLQIIDEGVDLQQTENGQGEHVFTGSNGLKTDERNLHRENQAESVECRIGNVKTNGITTEDQQNEDVHRNEIDDEDVAAPR